MYMSAPELHRVVITAVIGSLTVAATVMFYKYLVRVTPTDQKETPKLQHRGKLKKKTFSTEADQHDYSLTELELGTELLDGDRSAGIGHLVEGLLYSPNRQLFIDLLKHTTPKAFPDLNENLMRISNQYSS